MEKTVQTSVAKLAGYPHAKLEVTGSIPILWSIIYKVETGNTPNMSINSRMDKYIKSWHIHMTENSNKLQVHKQTWMNLTNIMLKERNQTEIKYIACDSIHIKPKDRQNWSMVLKPE